MKSNTLKILHFNLLLQFIKFGIVGLSNTIISFLIYTLLIRIGLHYLFASIIAFFVSVTNSFFWNKKYVFTKDRGINIFRSLFKTFISYGLTGLILTNILLFILIDVFEISKYLAPFIVLIITIPSNFLINKYWVFRD
ncbi:MAG: GtrA family protein [Bacteroidales bacterium]|jgi:putative flippase GtrA|nr:GtrA family protein [Bacteroidales bacterium]